MAIFDPDLPSFIDNKMESVRHSYEHAMDIWNARTIVQ